MHVARSALMICFAAISTASAAESICVTSFGQLGKNSFEAQSAKVRFRLGSNRRPNYEATRDAFPGIDNIETYCTQFKKMRVAWNRAHPDNLNNMPTAAMQPSMQYLREQLAAEARPPKVVAQLLRRFDELEKREFPYRDSHQFIEEASRFLSARRPLSGVTAIDRELYSIARKVAPEETVDSLNSKLKILETPRSTNYRKNLSEFRRELLKAIEDAHPADVGPIEELRRRFYASAEENQLPNVAREREPFDLTQFYNFQPETGVVIPTRGIVSVRAINESTLFKVPTLTISGRRPVQVDTVWTTASGARAHDAIHAIVVPHSGLKLMALGVGDKRRILNGIDSLPSPRFRELADAGLMLALHENMRKAYSRPEDYALWKKEVFDSTGVALSEAEHRWLVQWMRDLDRQFALGIFQ